mmetsp:Transcript_35601/g.75032  ORF Transcript_35601/g.75032 Transcript_35601/m.75032 type:complete len:103 (-) Transcript_35601:432-740(-)
MISATWVNAYLSGYVSNVEGNGFSEGKAHLLEAIFAWCRGGIRVAKNRRVLLCFQLTDAFLMRPLILGAVVVRWCMAAAFGWVFRLMFSGLVGGVCQAKVGV